MKYMLNMKKYNKITRISMKAKVNRATIANIWAGRRLPSWNLSKELAAAFPETSPIWWKEGRIDLLDEAINI